MVDQVVKVESQDKPLNIQQQQPENSEKSEAGKEEVVKAKETKDDSETAKKVDTHEESPTSTPVKPASMEIDTIKDSPEKDKDNDKSSPGASAEQNKADSEKITPTAKSEEEAKVINIDKPEVSKVESSNNDGTESTPQLPATTAKPGVPVPTMYASLAQSTKPNPTLSSASPSKQQPRVPPPVKSDPYMEHLRLEEDRIRLIRRSLSLKRTPKKIEPKETPTKKKRKRDSDVHKTTGIPGWRASTPKELSAAQEEEWLDASHKANDTVERWMAQYRVSQESYWLEKKRRGQKKQSPKERQSFYLQSDPAAERPCCQWCTLEHEQRSKRRSKKKPRLESRSFSGDELMQCLECSFVGCSPPSLAPDSRHHILQHLLVTGHNFAVSCGEKAQVFCFRCGDFVYHEVFEQEKVRIDCSKKFPYMAWKDHHVLRSFDAFQFLKTEDHGIVWRGLVATYPPIVPKEHFYATQLTIRRRDLFGGCADERWLLNKPNALNFAASQHLKSDEEKYNIVAPVGMYNHGNTCYMSAILQCLIFCKPLQQYFLRDVGHHHKSCELYRSEEYARATLSKTKVSSSKTKKSSSSITKPAPEICLACEMDCLFLSYFGSTVGKDVVTSIEESCRDLVGKKKGEAIEKYCEDVSDLEKGVPLVISELLTSAWKSGKMNHLAGYEQRDTHEFLNAFLEVLGKNIVNYRERIYAAVTSVDEEIALVSRPEKNDIGKTYMVFYVLF